MNRYFDTKYAAAVGLVTDELEAAEAKHPGFPHGPHAVACILAEEAGEVAQAANDIVYHGGSKEKLITELAHTAVVAIRGLQRMMEE